jgi:hypothetical protein
MLFTTVVATVLLGMAIILLGGTILVSLTTACAQPSRVGEIRRRRQEGLAAQHDESSM